MTKRRAAVHGGVQEVPKECCWHTVTVYRSMPSREKQRCCWCNDEREVVAEKSAATPHGSYKP